MKLKTAIIVDNQLLSKWQLDALNEVSEKINLKLILNCQNTSNKRKIFKNFFYYVLNYFSIRNNYSKKVKLNLSEVQIINFNSIYKEEWQYLPKKIVDQLISKKINLVVKFGMNLLKINDEIKNLPILSYHHGDPSKYRGRPAGFYEIFNSEKTVGIVVQQLSNKLDAGDILAFADSKIVNYSYKKTVINFYANSKYLLSKAIDNLLQKKDLKITKNGKIHKLPSNLKIIHFLLLLFLNFNRKIIYGLFFEKKWKVGLIKNKFIFNGCETISINKINKIPINKKYNFYADPFFSFDKNNIRLEALNKFNGLGEILEISIKNFNKQKLLLSKNHYSYPFSFIYKEKEYLLPEVASHTNQYILNINNKEKFFIKGLEKERIVDATFFEYKKYWYLFFGKKNSASTILNLWISISPFSEFKPHPMTPIVISPKNARMAGNILYFNNRLLRFGQNNEDQYGESLSIQEIDKLTPKEYSEKCVGYIKIDQFKGPHTLNFNFNNNFIVFDYYNNKFSLFAGIRRVLGLLNKK